MALITRFKESPLVFYALSVCATWAGIGSLMNGVAMTQTYGAVPSLIWISGNVAACIVFGLAASRFPKLRNVFQSKAMQWVCGIMCVFQSWLSMNGMQSVFADTVLGERGGMAVAYVLALAFLLILLRFGMIRNVLTDGFGWIAVYLLAVGVTLAAMVQSRGSFNAVSPGLEPGNLKAGLWKGFLLLPGPFTYPYFFELFSYNDGNADGTKPVNIRRAFILGGVFFGIYMAIVFPLAWVRFSPALALAKAVLITIIGASTLSSAMYSIYIAFGKKTGLAVNAGLIALWHVLMPLGVMGLWTLMASVRIYFVAAGCLTALVLDTVEKRKAARI